MCNPHLRKIKRKNNFIYKKNAYQTVVVGQLLVKEYVSRNPFSPPLVTMSKACCGFKGGPINPSPFRDSSVLICRITGPEKIPETIQRDVFRCT
jgi:hypothetical protein